MRYSINVKYWHDSHDHELYFATKADARHVFKALTWIAPNNDNDIEFISLWENDDLIECIHY